VIFREDLARYRTLARLRGFAHFGCLLIIYQ
jgi:hypothetical protein